MKTDQITIIINCNKKDIPNIDVSVFKKYKNILFNTNPKRKNMLSLIDNITSDYYSIWQYNPKYEHLDNLQVYPINRNINKKIDISILIPVYNCEGSIKDCIDSCLNQDFKGSYEIVIVDDGSTDKTIDIINSFRNNKIKLYTKKHSGISNTLNFGLDKCKGEYICRMDADDIMYSYRLTYQYTYMQLNKQCDILASNVNRYVNDNIYSHAPSLELIKKNIQLEDLFDAKLNYNFICHPAIFFKRELYLNVLKDEENFYNPEYDLAEDYELYARLISKYNVVINTDKISVLRYNVFKKSEDVVDKINKLNNKIFCNYCQHIIESYHIGIYYIATGVYKNDFKRFLLSVKNFFPKNKKTIVVISDGLTIDYNIDDNITIKHAHIDDYPWPIITLFKMKYISNNFINCDYVFYFNANAEILPIKSYEWFNKDKMTFAYHKDWFNNDRKTYMFCEPFMDNPNSTSYIGTTNYTYIQGAFFGGPSQLVYEMCNIINEMITIDLQNNIIPRYHDETYLNKFNYLYDNANIANVLISEIWNDKYNLTSIEDTQFILLHENIYNIKENNKSNKFSNFIPLNCLKPLYNNIHDYYENYPCNYKSNVKNDNLNLLVFLVYVDTTKEQINNICRLYDILVKKYNIICINDSRLDKQLLDILFSKFDSQHIFGLDVISQLHEMNDKISRQTLFFHSMNMINIFFSNDYWHNLLNNFDFNKVMFIDDINEFMSNECFNLYEYFNKDCDLLLKEYDKVNILEFVNHTYTKTFNLFKYKYKYKTQVFSEINNCVMSNNAYDFLYNYKDEIKFNTIPHYYIPTLLYNNQFTINTK